MSEADHQTIMFLISALVGSLCVVLGMIVAWIIRR
jgi:hypothetical protein